MFSIEMISASLFTYQLRYTAKWSKDCILEAEHAHRTCMKQNTRYQKPPSLAPSIHGLRGHAGKKSHNLIREVV